MDDDYRDWVGVDDEGTLENDNNIAELDDDGDNIDKDDGNDMDGPIITRIP